MMDGRCETCKWWDYHPNPIRVPDDTAECLLMGHNGTYPDYKDTLANAFSTDESDAVVFTHRRFGCVQWEERES